MFTRFIDMHSGGSNKIEDYEYIYIEADNEDAAIDRFQRLFNEDPYDVDCPCCGENFCISSYDTLEQATERGRTPKQSVEDYIKHRSVHVVFSESNASNHHAPRSGV